MLLCVIIDYYVNCRNTYLMSSHFEAIIEQVLVYHIYTSECIKTYQSK